MNVRELIELALKGLRGMQLADGLFCYEIVAGDPTPRGRSLRYSLMVYLGLVKAERHGYDHGFDLEAIWSALEREVGDRELRPGDFGLYLWADAVAGASRTDALVARLESSLAATAGLERREGMEVAWVVQGLGAQLAGGAKGRSEALFRESLERLLGNRAPSGLLYHFSTGRRRRFPNFATQIYGILALATVAKLGLDDRALEAATRAGDRVLSQQRPDGGWPWIYDADTGRVVEPYEIYAVHQHAMAPMGLLELAEATGSDAYVAAAARGLTWIHGQNELGLDFVDRPRSVIWRSIRRKRPWSRLALYANTASTAAVRRPLFGHGRLLELNATCRPYELGWLLQAWCGRETLLDR